MSDPVAVSTLRGVGIVTIDNPPVNAVSHAVREGLIGAFEAVEADASLAAIVIHCAGRTFVAGADIKEFDAPMRDPQLAEVVGRLEGLERLTVAAIHGTALGGGAELALGADYRCASPSARVGFPEVSLGIIPGAGGTQRLPRLVGARAALELIGSGAPVGAREALERGLIDEIVEGDLLDGAVAFALRLLDAVRAKRRLSRMTVPAVPDLDAVLAAARSDLAARLKGQNAPQVAVDAVAAAARLPFPEGMALERRLGEECLASTESAALRHLFFAAREVSRVPDLSPEVEPRPVESVAVIGAGTMGTGIAMSFADAGIPVTLADATPAALERGLSQIRAQYEGRVSRGRLDAAEAEGRIALIRPGAGPDSAGGADLVVEAVFEEMRVKSELFGALDRICRPGAILASNTSTLDLDEIASATSRPEDVIGLHFFSPAHVMRLLEIVRGRRTGDATLATALAVAKRLRKTGVVARVCYGFIGNRMMESYGREANMLVLEGAAPSQVDSALERFGMAMGPFAMFDMAGTDVGLKAHQAAADRLPNDPRYYRISHMVAERGRLGQKSGAGVYRYEAGSRTPQPDPAVLRMIEEEAGRLGVERRAISDEEIVERCIYPMVDEAARILEEGVAIRPGDVDVVWTTGYGFPRHRGGPLFYADSVGLPRVHARILELGRQLGNEHGYWTPSPLLASLARSGSCFGEWGSERSTTG
jgi:3-hydroxyacyl-CoA dehydrogenase